jgi:AGZA family xanthine/uracil permease-like MFS transporter
LGQPSQPFTPELIAKFKLSDTFIDGAFALEQGFVFSAMILAAITVWIIERKFGLAALWALAAALFSWLGLMHSYRWLSSDTVVDLGWGTGGRWALGYLLLALLFFYAAGCNPAPKPSPTPPVNAPMPTPDPAPRESAP